MRKKLRLDADSLSVASFEAGREEADRGTVVAQAACTCNATCVCPTSIYWCADIAQTVYSCDYSRNASCWTTS